MTTSRSEDRGGSGAVLRIAAGLVTDAQQRVLVVRKAGTRHWIQPGGKIEPGEQPDEALVREVREELGVALARPPEPMGVRRCAAANEAGCDIEASLFRVELAGEPWAGAEIAELRWIGPEDALGLPLAPLLVQHVLPHLWGSGR